MGCGCASLIIGGLTVVAAACFGKMIVDQFNKAAKGLYAGPEYYKMKKIPQPKVPDEYPKDSMHK